MSSDLSKKLSGPRPFRTITSSPYRTEIDERLFLRRDSVRAVHRWLTGDCGVDNISYISLTRYKNARTETDGSSDGSYRRSEIRRDVRFLGSFIKKGRETLDAGLAVRPSEVLRAIELRSHLLSEFPDASGESTRRHEAMLQELARVVKEVVTEEQRLEIMRRLGEGRSSD